MDIRSWERCSTRIRRYHSNL